MAAVAADAEEESNGLLPDSDSEDDVFHGGREEEEEEAAAVVKGASPPKVRTKTFLALVSVYIAPLAVCLARERPSDGAAYLTATPSVASAIAFSLLTLALYAAQRFAAASLRWKMNDKASHKASHKEDVFRMGLLNALLCGYGRVGARLDADDSLSFVALVVNYTFFFGVLFEMVKSSNIEFTRDCVQNPATLAFAAFLVFVLSALAVNHFSRAHDLARRHQDDGVISLPGALALVFCVVLFHVALALAPGASSAHWHHWYTGYLGALFCVFDAGASRVAHAMLLGIYLHGAAFFGVEPCFTTDEPPLALAAPLADSCRSSSASSRRGRPGKTKAEAAPARTSPPLQRA